MDLIFKLAIQGLFKQLRLEILLWTSCNLVDESSSVAGIIDNRSLLFQASDPDCALIFFPLFLCMLFFVPDQCPSKKGMTPQQEAVVLLLSSLFLTTATSIKNLSVSCRWQYDYGALYARCCWVYFVFGLFCLAIKPKEIPKQRKYSLMGFNI